LPLEWNARLDGIDSNSKEVGVLALINLCVAWATYKAAACWLFDKSQ
jgi:hypothetical protein